MFKSMKAKFTGSLQKDGAVSSLIVKNFFNSTKNLMFDEKSAIIEQKYVLDAIQQVKNKRILDLGCGDGRYSEIIHDYEYYQGVDFSHSFIEECKKRKEKNFICADVVDYTSTEKFNIVLLIGVITYLEDVAVRKLCSNVHKMLTDEGLLILRSVNLREKGSDKRYYDSGKWKNLLRLKPRYQIIRRSKNAEVNLFREFLPSSISDIEGTSYTLFQFKKV